LEVVEDLDTEEVVVVEAVAGVAQLECVQQVQVEITEEEPLMIGGATKIFEPLFIWSEIFGPLGPKPRVAEFPNRSCAECSCQCSCTSTTCSLLT